MESSVTLYDANMSESSLDINNESRERLKDKSWLINVKNSAFPPEHIAWLRGFERNPDTPLRQSYLRGIVQPEVDETAPIMQIGIIFLEGADKPTVAHAEMHRETRGTLNQKAPEWRVATAATLLRKFEIGDDLSITQPDDSRRLLEANKVNEPQRKRLPAPTHSDHGLPRSSSKRQSTGDAFQALAKRSVQDHVLTIDSDCVHLIHGDREVTCEYDIVCTLIEIDLQSICNLLANFREIIANGGRNVSAKEITMILDTMINDVRRLCTRSPTFFRMATRSIIANSKNTRYGVNYETVFATMTTSEGIRIFIERSVSYYLSLNDSKADQNTVRPKFLQMLVMLLALLNDDDLQKIGGLLEDTFKIPGNRQGLELVILKVLPLSSINSKVFMEDLLAACDIGASKVKLKDRTLQIESWHRLQTKLAREGYILPVVTKFSTSSEDGLVDDLEAMMEAQDLEDEEIAQGPPLRGISTTTASGMSVHSRVASQNPKSWLPLWPEEDGVVDSTIFKHIQHCGKTIQEGNLQQDTVKAVNNIPHLDITAEDKENEYVAEFSNGARYRISAEYPDKISAMKKAQYSLREVEGNSIVELEIDEDMLNYPFIEAVKQHNQLVDQINNFLGGRKEKRSRFSLSRSSTVSFKRIEEPVEATRVWAELNPQSGQHLLCAEAFKLGDRIVFREDVLNSMNATLSKLNRSVARIEQAVPQYQVKDSDKDVTRMQEEHIIKLMEALEVIKTLVSDATSKKKDLASLRGGTLPTDPISSVIYTSFIETSGEKPEWQSYVSRLHSDQERMIVQSKRLTVDNVTVGDIVKLEFHSSHLTLSIQRLTSAASKANRGDSFSIKNGDTVLWMGYYIVHVEPVQNAKRSYEVLAFYRVLSQQWERVARGSQSAADMLQGSYLI